METQLILSDLPLDVFSLALGAAGGMIVAAVILLGWVLSLSKQRAALEARIAAKEEGMDDHIRALAQTALQSNAESFLMLAQEKLKQSQDGVKGDLEKRTQAIAEMVKPVEKYLEQLKGSVDQLQGTDKAIREDLLQLSRETAKLSGALRNPAAQGRWGEYVLERLLTKANLIKGVHYETQKSVTTEDGRLRPDATITLQDGFSIVIDAKAPITEFMNRIDDVMDEAGHVELNKTLARAVRSHVKALAARDYAAQIEGADFVVLFLPSEHIFSSALSADIDLVDYATDNKVIIASPTVLMSLLRVVHLSWRQAGLAQNAQEISKLGGQLFERIASFAGHLDKIGASLNTAAKSYMTARNVLERNVLSSARKLKDLHAAPANATLEAPRTIESAELLLTDQTDAVDESNGTTTKRYG
jgi:DNA recombination protein RmuC